MNLPELFKEQMKALLGEEYDAFAASYDKSEHKRVHGLRVNTKKISVDEFLKLTPFSLKPVPWTENGFYYDNEDAVTKHPHYHAGLYYIQEPSAMIPAANLPIAEGDMVLDLCAAPGGKATELGAKLKGSGMLVANDISHSRAKGLLKNLELFGISNVLVTSETPAALLKQFGCFFDKILVDAPCSGEGMFRKDPSMVKDWETHGPEYYAKIQREILDTAVQLLKPGGMLLYSTCTFSPLENEEMISGVLERFEDISLASLDTGTYLSSGQLPGTLRVWPHKTQGEGHFAALLKKSGDPLPVKGKAPEKTKLSEEAEMFLRQIPGLNSGDSLLLKEERLYLLPDNLQGLKGLRFLRTGLYLGECKKKRFEPSQALAMYLGPETYANHISLDANDARVLRYLKGETLTLSPAEAGTKKGWVLVCVDGYSLGWAKVVNGTMRNKYYPGWRLQ